MLNVGCPLMSTEGFVRQLKQIGDPALQSLIIPAGSGAQEPDE